MEENQNGYEKIEKELTSKAETGNNVAEKD